MKLTQVVFLSLFMYLPFVGKAQYFSKGNNADLSISSNFSQSAVALSAFHMHQLGKKKKFGIGYGIRYTGNFGNNSDFITAPAELTSGTTGLGVLTSETILENLDTLSFSRHQVNSLNLAIYLQYLITSKLAVEFNIDAVGFSFGADQVADYNSSKRLQSPNQETKQPASVSPFNALLTSDNDLGSLNSEILLRYQFTEKLKVKFGGTFVFTEYTTKNKLYLDNDRFRNKSFQPMLGLNYFIN